MGVVVTAFGTSPGEEGFLFAAWPFGDFDGLAWGNESLGVDMTRVRGVAGIVLFTCVSDSDV